MEPKSALYAKQSIPFTSMLINSHKKVKVESAPCLTLLISSCIRSKYSNTLIHIYLLTAESHSRFRATALTCG